MRGNFIRTAENPEPPGDTGRAAFLHLTGVDLAFISTDAVAADWRNVADANPVCGLVIEASAEWAGHVEKLFAGTDRAQAAVRTAQCSAGLAVATVAATSPDGKRGFLYAGPVVVTTKQPSQLIQTITINSFAIYFLEYQYIVPEPGTPMLVGAGVATFALFRRRMK
jgi:hypothetical protein